MNTKIRFVALGLLCFGSAQLAASETLILPAALVKIYSKKSPSFKNYQRSKIMVFKKYIPEAEGAGELPILEKIALENANLKSFQSALSEIANDHGVIISPIRIATPNFNYALVIYDPHYRKSDEILQLVAPKIKKIANFEVDLINQ